MSTTKSHNKTIMLIEHKIFVNDIDYYYVCITSLGRHEAPQPRSGAGACGPVALKYFINITQ